MRASRTILAAVVFAVSAGSSAHAQDDDAGERRASQLIRSRVTSDGSTVGEVIGYVAKRRPKRFTFSQITASRLSPDGPYDVFVCFYNGSQRGEDREDCATSYTVALTPPLVSIPGDPANNPAHALEKGKSAFLAAVDREYEIYCGSKPPDKCRSKD